MLLSKTKQSLSETISIAIIFICAAITLVLINPYWYGDAVWYATDLKNGTLLPLDSGHLFWKPLAFFLWSIQSLLFIECDPLIILQLMSAVATIGSSIVLYLLALHLRLKHPVVAPLAFLSSHFALFYGGSGSSYSSCVMFFLFAVYFYLHTEKSASTKVVGTATLFALSLASWAPGVLGLPTLMALPFLESNDKNIPRRLFRGVLLVALSSAFFGLLLFIGFLYSDKGLSIEAFFSWLRSASHGIPPGVSLLNSFRALLGFIQTHLYVGELGIAIKDLLTGGEMSPPYFSFSLFLIALGVVLFRLVSYGSSFFRSPVAILFLTTLFPSFVFGMIWQGSDVERFSLVLPFLLLFLLPQAGEQSKRIPLLVYSSLVLFALNNFAFLFLFPEKTKAPLISEMIAVTTDYLPRGSLLIVSGQDLGPRIWAPVSYHSGNTVHSLLYDAQTEGVSGWEKRLANEIRETLANGAEVAVLDSLISDSPNSPNPILTAADPHPKQRDLYRFFADYFPSKIWSVKRYNFITVLPPKKAKKQRGSDQRYSP